MFGQMKRLTNKFTGTIAGKGLEYRGSLIGNEATSYGAVCMLENMLQYANNDIQGMDVLISGSGNVTIYAAEKTIPLGAKVMAMSGFSVFIHDKNGINAKKLAYIKDLKIKRRACMAEYTNHFEADYYEDKKPPRVCRQIWPSPVPRRTKAPRKIRKPC